MFKVLILCLLTSSLNARTIRPVGFYRNIGYKEPISLEFIDNVNELFNVKACNNGGCLNGLQGVLHSNGVMVLMFDNYDNSDTTNIKIKIIDSHHVYIMKIEIKDKVRVYNPPIRLTKQNVEK